ncbi:MAG TPA: hypothetical protein VNR17_14495 [Luteimicrobium sp.]|nr:hypothetical protein [Luteimicrobium sp.]
MTLLHTVLTAHHAALRDAARATWPADAVHSPDDVLLGDRSLVGLAGRRGTPFVVVATAVEPAAQVPLVDVRPRSIVVARVEATVPRLGGRLRQVWLDADLDACAPVTEHARLLGRVGRAGKRRFTVHPAPGRAGAPAHLPDDLHDGDLVAVPCLGVVDPEELRR